MDLSGMFLNATNILKELGFDAPGDVILLAPHMASSLFQRSKVKKIVNEAIKASSAIDKGKAGAKISMLNFALLERIYGGFDASELFLVLDDQQLAKAFGLTSVTRVFIKNELHKARSAINVIYPELLADARVKQAENTEPAYEI